MTVPEQVDANEPVAVPAVRPSTPVIGAEVGGVDLRDRLPEAVVAEIRALLGRHKVLFFRDQHLSTGEHLAFARRFGAVLSFPGVLDAHPDHPGVQIAGRGAGWHIDASGLVAAPHLTILRAVTLPEVGGDTVWANLAAAYAGLPAGLRERLDGLYVTHNSVRHLQARGGEQPLLARPLVCTHPGTGERILYLNLLADPLIVGWAPADSAALIRDLRDEVTRPEYQVRFTWTVGAVALWDNRAVHHYGVHDYGDAPRRMERVLVTDPVLPLIEQLL